MCKNYLAKQQLQNALDCVLSLPGALECMSTGMQGSLELSAWSYMSMRAEPAAVMLLRTCRISCQ